MKNLWCKKCAVRLQTVRENGQETYRCPHCKGNVGEDTQPESSQPSNALTGTEIKAGIPGQYACPGCGALVSSERLECPFCRELLHFKFPKEVWNQLAAQDRPDQQAARSFTGSGIGIAAIFLILLLCSGIIFLFVSCFQALGGFNIIAGPPP